MSAGAIVLPPTLPEVPLTASEPSKESIQKRSITRTSSKTRTGRKSDKESVDSAYLELRNSCTRNVLFKLKCNDSNAFSISPKAVGILAPQQRCLLRLNVTKGTSLDDGHYRVVVQSLFLPYTSTPDADPYTSWMESAGQQVTNSRMKVKKNSSPSNPNIILIQESVYFTKSIPRERLIHPKCTDSSTTLHEKLSATFAAVSSDDEQKFYYVYLMTLAIFVMLIMGMYAFTM